MASMREFQRKFSKAILGGDAAIFAGAGLSRPSGYVNWKELLKSIAEDIDLDVMREPDLVAVAQYYCNEKRGRAQLNQAIFNEFVSAGRQNKSLDILSKLPIHTYWTTNYDHMIEDTLKRHGKLVDIKITPQSLATPLEGRDAVVYKMHGDYTAPEGCVITKDDYEAYNLTRQLFSTALQGDLVSKTFLFIGFSFDDPNLGYILSRIRMLLGENQREHFCLFEKPRREAAQGETDEAFSYRCHKLELRIHDLQRYGINAVMVDRYSQIPDILECIARQVKSNCVFLSGSAVNYGNWTEENAINLVRTITDKLCDQGYRIMTGHGRGIGSYVIGAILEKYGNNIHEIERHLLIRAFPFQDKRRENYAKLVTEYRKGIFQQAGTAIFMFGNKDGGGGIIEAPGMYQEYELAKANRCCIIPLASTGFVASRVYDEILSVLDSHPYLSDSWVLLRDTLDPETLAEEVLIILERIKRSFQVTA